MSSQRTVLITGCSEGSIGDFLAREFASPKHDFRVFASGRNAGKLGHFASLALPIETVSLDVTSQASIDAAVRHVSDATGGTLDVLVNNAGADYIAPLLDTPVAAGRQLYEVNVFGVVAVTQACFPLLRRSAVDGGEKALVANIGSIVAMGPLGPWQAFYASSKAALHSLGDAMRLEFAVLGVDVVTVVTGGVGSRLFENVRVERIGVESFYYPIRRFIEERLFLAQHKNMDGKEYARKVVEKLVGKSRRKTRVPWIWEGAFARLIWVVWKFGWVGMIDEEIRKRAGLNELKVTLRQEKVKDA